MRGSTRMRLFDSHCHLDFPALTDRDDRRAMIARARSVGVDSVLIPGVGPAQWERSAAVRWDGFTIRRAVGVHPQNLHAEALDALASHALRDVHAIGELGWDRRGPATRAEQDHAADVQLELARTHALPVVLHIVGEHGHALERLRRHRLVRGGVLHAYSGSAEMVPLYAALGLSFAFGPALLNERAERARHAARCVGDDRLLVETDAPDRALPGSAPGRGEPADCLAVVARLAQIRDASVESIAELTHRNASRMFR